MISPKTAAARLGLSVARVRQLIATGALKAKNIGLDRPVWAIEEAELDRFAALDRPDGRPRKESKMSNIPKLYGALTPEQRQKAAEVVALFGDSRTPRKAWIDRQGIITVIELPDDEFGYWHEIMRPSHFEAKWPSRTDADGQEWAMVPQPQKPAWM